MVDNALPFLGSEQPLYALVDGALIKGFYDELAQFPDLRYKSLFAGTIDEGAASSGPILLALPPDNNQELIAKLLTLQTEKPTPIWLSTTIAFTPLFNLLRELLYVEKEGEPHFFRYYDWICFPGFLLTGYAALQYTYRLQQIEWAIWQQEEKKYHYFDKNYQGETA